MHSEGYISNLYGRNRDRKNRWKLICYLCPVLALIATVEELPSSRADVYLARFFSVRSHTFPQDGEVRRRLRQTIVQLLPLLSRVVRRPNSKPSVWRNSVFWSFERRRVHSLWIVCVNRNWKAELRRQLPLRCRPSILLIRFCFLPTIIRRL